MSCFLKLNVLLVLYLHDCFSQPRDLRNDNSADAMESVPELLLHAEAVGVDEDFILRVRRCYENTSPRLRARGKLRCVSPEPLRCSMTEHFFLSVQEGHRDH